jgi:hypothetical protein
MMAKIHDGGLECSQQGYGLAPFAEEVEGQPRVG